MPAYKSTETTPGETPDARSLVFSRLARQVIRFPDLAIEPMDASGLSARERAFARALEVAVLSRWRTLETILATRLERSFSSIEPRVRAALLGGAAQLLFMDRIPDHAAVAESVDWAKRVVRPGAGGLVNGVLRAVARLRAETLPREDERTACWWLHRDLVPLESGEALRLEEPIFAEDAAMRLAQQASLGEELLVGWIDAQGWECAQQRARHCIARPPIFLHRADETKVPWNGSHAELAELLSTEPAARVQDPGSAMPVEATHALQPKLIVDYCAGRGTKTKQLALLHPNAEILATDVDMTRLRDLRAAFEGHDRVRVLEPAALGRVLARVDLLLLDVPCSNTGVLPRRPQARYRFNAERSASLGRLQKQIVEEATPLLAPGAHLLYATCSLEPMENERQATWIQKRFNVAVCSQGRIEPRGVPGDPPEAYADGGFHALFTPDRQAQE